MDKLKLLNPVISDLLSTDQFDLLSRLFEANSLSIDELKIFYRRNKKLFTYEIFWKSNLPFFEVAGLLRSELKITFLRNYFSRNEFCNEQLNQKLLESDLKEFQRNFKLWQAFKHDNFINSLKNLSSHSKQAENFYKEIEIIKKAQEFTSRTRSKLYNYIKQYPLDELFLGFALEYQSIKRNPRSLSNKAYQTKIEMAIVDELNIILKGGYYLDNKTSFERNHQIQAIFSKNERPHPILEPNRKYDAEERFQHISNLINKLLHLNSNQRVSELYLSGFAEFESKSLNPAHLSTTKEFELFKYNDLKSVPEEYFISDFKLNIGEEARFAKRVDGIESVKYLNYYGIPSEIDGIKLERIFRILKHFSIFKGPPKHQIDIDNKKSMGIINKPDRRFENLFGSNESLTIFKEVSLIEGIAEYFNWPVEEVEKVMSYLIFDLGSKTKPVHWLYRPFLRFQNKIYWLGSFMKDRRWETVIFGRIKNESQGVSSNNQYSKKFELEVEQLFKRHSFKTLQGENFKLLNGEQGDLDVLVYKEGHLFIIEAKQGVGTNEYSHASRVEARDLEGRAEYQLSKALDYIKENWNELKKKLSIEENLKFTDLILSPLIVTNYFEADQKTFGGFYKTTLVELDVIINNRKKDLLNLYLQMQNPRNRNNREFIAENIEIEWDLWGGLDACLPSQIMNCISRNLVWRELEKMWNFQSYDLRLNY